MYTIQTKPKTELDVLYRIESLGYTAYVPREERQIRKRGKWHSQINMIFSGYVFIDVNEISNELYYQLKKIDGFIRILGSPSPLSPTECEQIKWLCNSGNIIAPSHYIITEDGKIKFVDGVVMNLRHLIVDFKLRQKRVKLRITVEGKFFTVTLPVEKL
jgi:transcription antitermination factor NusG